MTRDGFDLLVHYLPDYDFASHAFGPDAAHDALARADSAIGALLDAAGGGDELLERYAIILCSDHGQTHVEGQAYLNRSVADLPDVLSTASNRAGMLYRLKDTAPDARVLAERLDGEDSVDVSLFLEGEEAVARHRGEEIRFGLPAPDGTLFGHPDGQVRAWSALHNPNAGDVIVSAAEGYEFADLAGRHHGGGGSHGSLAQGDSEVPMLTIGVDTQPQTIVDVAPTIIRHFGVEPPAYQAEGRRTVAA